MSVRGLVVALLCGALGLGIGALVGRVTEPRTTEAGAAFPIGAVSPSVPSDPPSTIPIKPDITFRTLSAALPLPPPDHVIGNDLATWHYRIPAGWQAYAVCSTPGECQPPMTTDTPLTARQAARQPEVRFRPPDEPPVGGYSLRVKILDNNLGLNPGQMVSTKIQGFKQSYEHFQRLRQTPSAVYFTYIDENDHLRYNYFQWFAAAPSTTATLEMSVAGRAQDVPGLKALFNRFALIVSGTTQPYRPAGKTKAPAQPRLAQ
jgi:hypothetical protein